MICCYKECRKAKLDHAHRLIQRGNEYYVFDGVGNRIKVTRNGQATKYIFDAAGNLLAEANNSNQITRYYIYGQGLLGFVNASTNQLYTYLFDGTGHTVAITNQNRQIVNSYSYDPYGRLMAQTETIAQPFKYAGQFGVQAEENNLYYMRARYYDADIGRFISEDPIGFEGGLNLYAYVGGNPVMFVDPSGFSAERIGISQAQIVQFQQDAFDIAIGFALPASRIGNLLRGVVKGLPSKADDLLKQGYKETSHPGAAKAGHRTFENSKTGDNIRFDQGKPGKPGYEGQDHYHRYNPNATGKTDQYLDKNGNPCARGCDASHLFPGD